MSVDVAAVQEALKAEGLDGWLLYDFRGSNPIAARLAGIGEGGGHLATRRWFYLVPSSGEPRGLVHAIERHNLDHLPGPKSIYAGRVQLESGLKELLTGMGRVAMPRTLSYLNATLSHYPRFGRLHEVLARLVPELQ